jgi:nitrite reductase/ring-hydroxylating ferredoxin subunit
MWTEVAKLDEIAPGGLKYVRAGDDAEITLCNYGNVVYAVSRRCGHMNGPLDQGALDGWVLTCAFHNVQFDIRNGKALNYAIEHDMGDEPLPEPVQRWFRLEHRMQWRIRIHDLKTWPVKLEDGVVFVDV